MSGLKGLKLLQRPTLVSTFRFNATKATAESTANSNEIRLFENLCDDWWNIEGSLRLLVKMNQVRVPIIQECLTKVGLAHDAYAESKTPLRGIEMLDVGCGGGLLSEALAKLGADVTGLDAGQDLLQIARTHMARDAQLQKHLRYQHALIEDFSTQHQERFDAVVSSEVIEHVDHPELFVRHCVECLKPGGSIIFTTMDRTPPGGLFNIVLLEYVQQLNPKGTHTYDKFIRPRELRQMLAKYGCDTVGVQGFTVNSLTEQWFKVPVTWFNYALHAIKRGSNSNQAGACKYAKMTASEHSP